LNAKWGKKPREIFLSHSSRDRTFALRLARVLSDHGLPVWFSPTELVPAQEWHDEIGAALARCDWFVVVVSPNAIKSQWVRRELVYALGDRRYGGRIVPVIRRTCNWRKLSWALPGLQKVDFTSGFAAGCRELLAVWGKGYRGS